MQPFAATDPAEQKIEGPETEATNNGWSVQPAQNKKSRADITPIVIEILSSDTSDDSRAATRKLCKKDSANFGATGKRLAPSDPQSPW